MWEPLLNPIWVTEALNRPQKGLYIVRFLNHIVSIVYEHGLQTELSIPCDISEDDKMDERKDVEAGKVTRNPGTSTVVSQIGVFMVDNDNNSIVAEEFVGDKENKVDEDDKQKPKLREGRETKRKLSRR